MSEVQTLPRTRRNLLGRPGNVWRPAGFLIAISLIAALLSPSFLTLRNLLAVATSSSFLVVLAVGEAFVILVGMIDLGIESVLSAGGMFVAWLTVLHAVSWPLAVLAGLFAGGLSGLGVGLLVSRGGIPSFIVTLGTYWGIRGIALLFNQGNYISPDAVSPARPFGFAWMAASVHGVSVLILITLVIVVLGQALISFTPLGSWIRGVGSNESAVRAVGLPSGRIKIFVFVVSGTLAALAGIMLAAWQQSIYPLSGEGDSLSAIAGVILGGIPFTGGRGSIVGAALGVLVIGVINDVIVLLGLASLYQYIFVACILILAGLQARLAYAK
ncbi:MAG TPA: ABC transporter permease [Acetobacteraceae bacterium]|nr:ABC transporter permease [Acetobacteraceae bacterium]